MRKFEIKGARQMMKIRSGDLLVVRDSKTNKAKYVVKAVVFPHLRSIDIKPFSTSSHVMLENLGVGFPKREKIGKDSRGEYALVWSGIFIKKSRGRPQQTATEYVSRPTRQMKAALRVAFETGMGHISYEDEHSFHPVKRFMQKKPTHGLRRIPEARVFGK